MRKRVAIALIDNNELLVIRRVKNGEEYLVLPGGSIETGETLEQAAKREMKEETSLTISSVEKLFDYTDEEKDLAGTLVHTTTYSGTPTLTGELKDRQHEDNQYTLEWLSVYELKYHPLKPEVVKNEILKRFGQKWRWDKIVRDKIPEIIESRGRTSTWHVATDQEFWHGIKEKLREEVEEFNKNESEKELVDIYEIIDAIIQYKQFDPKKIQQVKVERLEERGGYEKRIFLEESTGD